MPYALVTLVNLGSGSTGIDDLRAQLVDQAGADVGTPIDTGFVERRSGVYLWYYDAFPDGFRGGVEFYSAADPAVILAATDINPQVAEPASAFLDEPDAVDGSTPREFYRMVGSVLLGKSDGAGTHTERFWSMDGTKVRLTAQVDTNGNRTSITMDKT